MGSHHSTIKIKKNWFPMMLKIWLLAFVFFIGSSKAAISPPGTILEANDDFKEWDVWFPWDWPFLGIDNGQGSVADQLIGRQRMMAQKMPGPGSNSLTVISPKTLDGIMSGRLDVNCRETKMPNCCAMWVTYRTF